MPGGSNASERHTKAAAPLSSAKRCAFTAASTTSANDEAGRQAFLAAMTGKGLSPGVDTAEERRVVWG
jgi:hypothetical protein